MITKPEPPTETELRATRHVIRCGTVEITSNGMGHGALTVGGVELRHRELSFTSNYGEMDSLVIRTTPRDLSKFADALRAAPSPPPEAE